MTKPGRGYESGDTPVDKLKPPPPGPGAGSKPQVEVKRRRSPRTAKLLVRSKRFILREK